MAQVVIEIPEGVSAEVAKRVATEAVQSRAAVGRVQDVLSRAETAPGPGLLAQIALREDLWRRVEATWGLLSAQEVTAATGGNVGRARDHTSNLRRRRGLAGVRRNGSTVYPGFQLARVTNAPATVAAAWSALAEAMVPAGWEQADLLMWAASPNAWLDGGSPADDVHAHPDEPTDRLLLAARNALPPGLRGTGDL